MYDDTEKSIQVFDLDSQQTISEVNMSHFSNIGGPNIKKSQIK